MLNLRRFFIYSSVVHVFFLAAVVLLIPPEKGVPEREEFFTRLVSPDELHLDKPTVIPPSVTPPSPRIPRSRLRERAPHGTPDEFLRKVVAENFLPLPLFTNDRKNAFQYLLQCLRELSRQVPYYRLYFKKDESFWDHIATVEVPHGQHSAAVHQKN